MYGLLVFLLDVLAEMKNITFDFGLLRGTVFCLAITRGSWGDSDSYLFHLPTCFPVETTVDKATRSGPAVPDSDFRSLGNVCSGF